MKNNFRSLAIAVIGGLMVIEIGALIERWRDPLTQCVPYAVLGVLGFCALVVASAVGTTIAFRILRRKVG
jgi:hypothetical protein